VRVRESTCSLCRRLWRHSAPRLPIHVGRLAICTTLVSKVLLFRDIFPALAIVLIQSPRVRRMIQVSLAVMALLLALVVGPETHVHQGEGPNRETVVHLHFGIVGHVHGGSPSGPGLSRSDANGPAIYLNAYSSIARHATTVPILIPQPVNLFAPVSSAEVDFSQPEVRAHAPPLIDSTRPRSPPLAFSA
jgi:hypothetical protein